MLEHEWDQFVIYVNAYYAVQEAYDAARREWERPADGLKAFCRDANPFLWDGKASAEETIYEGFSALFARRFPSRGCTAAAGRAFARDWLATLEGGDYGTSLVSSLDEVADEQEWERACLRVERQLAARAAHLERTPQDEPAPFEPPAPVEPSPADIEAVIALLSKGDEAFATSLRARLASDEG